MKTDFFKKHLSFILCMVLIVAMALSASGCNGDAGKEPASVSSSGEEAPPSSEAEKEPEAQTDVQAVGEGDAQFLFSVVDQDGNETRFEVHTDKESVGEALQELGLIDGEEGDYGLYVKTVNGITADYDKDGVYWAFYVNDEYAQESVDLTPITEGADYAFKVEKG